MSGTALRPLVAAAFGVLLTGIVLAVVLAQRDTRLAGTNSLVEFSGAAVPVAGGRARCAAQDVPPGANAVRVYAGTHGAPGEPVAVTVRHGGRIVDRGRAPGGYPDAAQVKVPLERETARWRGAQVCVRNLGRRPLQFAGTLTPLGAPPVEEEPIRTDWLLPGRPSWAGIAGRVADRFHATKPGFVGAWTLWALAGVLALLWVAAIGLVVVGHRRLSVRTACAVCAAIGFVNGGVWALVTPPLQIPDEGAHFTYVQYIAERGALPTENARPGRNEPHSVSGASPELEAAAAAIPFTLEGRPQWFDDALRDFRRAEDGLARKPPASSLAASTHPPLYYAVELLPYAATRSAGFLDRLFAMRLMSCLLGALAVALVFLFAREVLPRHPSAAPVAALATAFQPLFGFMSGGVNNDNLVVTLAAALMFLTARTMRRGLTLGVGLAMAAVGAAGFLTKTTFVGLLPGAAVAALVAIARMDPARRRRAVAVAAGATAAFGLAVGAWLVANQTVFDRSAQTTTGGLTGAAGPAISPAGQLSYLWQVFLPKLPWMQEFEPISQQYMLWDTYIQGFVGRFGWWRFGFPMWVNWLGLGVLTGIVALAAAALVRARAALRSRWPEALAYGIVAAGFVVLIEVAGYRYQAIEKTAFEQARYLLPLLPLYALTVGVATLGAGRRWAGGLGALLVVVVMAHSLFSMLLVIGHYYA